MKKDNYASKSCILFLLLLSVFIIVACSNDAPPAQDSQQARKMVDSLIYFGIIGGPGPAINISSIDSVGTDWVMTLTDSSQLSVDKSTSIIHCIKPKDAEKTCGLYIVIIDSAVIMDTKSFSCVPLDSNSMDCKPEILDKYQSLKARFLAQ